MSELSGLCWEVDFHRKEINVNGAGRGQAWCRLDLRKPTGCPDPKRM